jgi:hypothetical protein
MRPYFSFPGENPTIYSAFVIAGFEREKFVFFFVLVFPVKDISIELCKLRSTPCINFPVINYLLSSYFIPRLLLEKTYS